MKKFKFFSLLAMVMLCAGFVSCSDDDDDENPVVEEKITTADVTVDIETTDDLRKVADFNVYFTDLSGNTIDISEDVAIARNHVDGDSKAIDQLSLPLELNLVMEVNFKSDVEPGEYTCGYSIKHQVSLLDKDGKSVSFVSTPKNHTMVLDLPNPELTKMSTVSSKITIKKDKSGNLVLEK